MSQGLIDIINYCRIPCCVALIVVVAALLWRESGWLFGEDDHDR